MDVCVVLKFAHGLTRSAAPIHFSELMPGEASNKIDGTPRELIIKSTAAITIQRRLAAFIDCSDSKNAVDSRLGAIIIRWCLMKFVTHLASIRCDHVSYCTAP